MKSLESDMPRLLVLMASLVFALGLPGCGKPTHEDLARESIGTMNEIADVLAKITDKASAQKHVGELEKLSAKMKEQKAQMDKMGEPSEKDAEAMLKKLEGDLNAATQKMTREMSRIAQDPAIMEVLGPVFEKMGQ